MRLDRFPNQEVGHAFEVRIYVGVNEDVRAVRKVYRHGGV